MDVERVVAARLMEATGVRAVLEVPAERPDEFISVERTGGSGTQFTQDATLAIQSWAGTRRRAAEIAALVEGSVMALLDEPNIFSAVADGSYRWPDPDSRQERYQTMIEVSICE